MPDASVIAQLDHWLEANRSIAGEGLRRFVQIPSVTGTEGAAQRWFAQQLEGHGLSVTLQWVDEPALQAMPSYLPSDTGYAERPNVLATLVGSGGGRNLLLVSHVDTVPAGASWRHDPWAAELEVERIYGRGTADAKGGLWAAALAAAALRAVAAPLRGNVIVASVVEEETTGNGALELCRRGLTADEVVVLEPTGLNVCYGHQGVFGLRVDVPGVAGHGAQRSSANAVVRAAEVVGALDHLQQGWATPWRPDYPAPVLNLARISGGDELFTVPDSCLIEATVRFPPGHGSRVQDAVRAAAAHSWDGPTGPLHTAVTVPFVVDAAHTPSDHALLQRLWQAARAVQPGSSMGSFPATCDARHFTRLGLPVAIFGPGSLGRAHGPKEFLTISELLGAARILARLALARCA